MSGQFTIGSPDPSTGKAHMVTVQCDLCTAEPILFDPRKVENGQNEISRIVKDHLCKKPERVKKKRRVSRVIKPTFTEHQIGDRRHRLGRPEEEDYE